MITKLYNLTKQHLDQKIVQKQQLLSKINDLDNNIDQTYKEISTASVQLIGAINDFKVLAIHKSTMKEHIVRMNRQKASITKQINLLNIDITRLNKEKEQFDYIKKEEIKIKNKKMFKAQEQIIEEYVQSRWKAS